MGHLALVEHAHHVEVGGLRQDAALDVLVEGDDQVATTVEDTAGRRRRSHELRTRHVADDGHLVALAVHIIAALSAHRPGTEHIGLVAVVALTQVDDIVQLVRSLQGGQQQQVRVVGHPILVLGVLLEGPELGVVLSLALQKDARQRSHRVIVAADGERLLSLGVGVHEAVRSCQLHIRAHGLEEEREGGRVGNLWEHARVVGLTDRRDAEHDVLVVQHVGVRLLHGERLGHGVAGRHEDGASLVDVDTVHLDDEAVGVRLIDHVQVVPHVLARIAVVAQIDLEGADAAGGDAGDELSGSLNLGFLNLHGLLRDDESRLIVLCLHLVLVGAAGGAATGVEDGAVVVGSVEHIDRQIVVVAFLGECEAEARGILIGADV